MELHLVYDASIPPSKPYPGAEAVAGYLGGNTPHQWSSTQWNAASGNGILRQLGIWVGYLEENPVMHAIDAVKIAKDLGWNPDATPRRFIALDKETQEDRAWVDAFAARVNSYGFQVIEYRSVSAIEQNPSPSIVWNWAADWFTKPNFNLVPRTLMFQFAPDINFDGTRIDLSVATTEAFDKFGRGKRWTI